MILIEEQPIVIQKDETPSALVNVIKVSDFRREFSPDRNTLYVTDKDHP